MANDTITNSIDTAKAATGRFFKKLMWFLLFALILGGIGYYFYRNYTVSEGIRTGKVFKISKKGIAFKTYEGEMQLAGAQVMTPESVWKFSAENSTIYEQIQQLENKTVKLHYREKQQAFPWQGDTNYIVWKVEAEAEEAPTAAPPVMVPAPSPAPDSPATQRPAGH